MVRQSTARAGRRLGAIAALGAAVLVPLLAAAGCKRSKTDSAAGVSSVPAAIASGLPIEPEIVSRIVNPRGEPAYSGPTGTVRGVVRMSGDAPPDQPDVVAKIPPGCEGAREVYGKLFREGTGRTLADVFVAVTGYRGYVPPRASTFVVEGNQCAWSTRTVAVTFGERIDIVAKDRRPYVPQLMGARMPAQIIAMPGGPPSALYAQQPGRYVLVDSMRLYSTAEVLVVKYATFDVTGLDGRYEIDRIPVGDVTLNAVLPATGETVERKLKIEAGKTLEVDLVLNFDEKLFRERAQGAPGTSAAPSAAAPSGAAGGTSPATSAAAP